MRALVQAGIALLLATATPQTAHTATPITPEMRTVTLITGDRLLVAPDGTSATRLPAPGRDGVPLLSRFAGGRLEVVPADAAALLAGDRLDPRLFDVTELVADGDDDTAGATPLIITYDRQSPAAAVRAAAAGAEVRDLDTINAIAVRVAHSTTAATWRSLTDPRGLLTAYRKVWLDGVARPSIDVSVPLVGAPAAWAAGWTGAAVGVGILDTGVDASHPDLAQSVAASVDFTADGDGVDRAGHGTHVASIIAGSGAASAGRYRGMAPDAQLYSAKVCRAGVCPESSILAGMQWAARDENLRVVTMSLGRPDQPGTDLLEQAVDTLTARYGTLFVVAAGNESGRVASPAAADAALAVGATTIDDQVAAFSDTGPRIGDGGLKPDLAAPGVDIVAARSSASNLPRTGPGGLYTGLSGTSMAAPHVAGAAAMVAQEHPDWTPAQLKSDLMNAATPLAGASVDQVGAGRLDVAKAVAATVVATPASVSFRPGPGTATVTYRNSGAAPVTLRLSGPAGIGLAANTVRIPAHGEASAVVAAQPSRSGRRTGALTATGDGISVRTPYEVERAPRTYRLTVRYTDRTGAPAAGAYGGVFGAGGSWTRLPDAAGTGTVSLPAGTYTVNAAVLGAGTTLLAQPNLVLDRDTTVELDARLGMPVLVTAPATTQVYANVGFTLRSASARLQTTTFDGVYTAQVGGGLPGFRTEVAGSWTAPGSLYSLAWSVPDRWVTGFARTVSPAGLATVRASYGGAGPVYLPFVFPGDTGGSGYASVVGAPFTRTEFVNAGDGVRWGTQVGAAAGPFVAYAPGHTYTQTWNTPVFGPAFPPPNPWANEVSRTGNTLTVNPSWFSDATGDHGGPFPGAQHHLTVSRDGTVLSDTASAAVSLDAPAAAGVFTITDRGSRSADLSTGGRTVWTFRSGRTGGKTVLPLSAIRFTPRAGGVLAFRVQHQSGSAAGMTTAFGLQVSYDDGTTWRSPLFSRLGDRGVAVLSPPGGTFVSLRAWAADADANRVDETLLRAYRSG
jgi:subtilisin family serine protease